MNIGEKVKTMLQSWLNIIPASPSNITIMEQTDFATDVMRAELWYRGDASELWQFYKHLGLSDGSFWSSVTAPVRKIHSGLPAIMADTLAYLVKSDLDKVETDSPLWEDIAKSIKFTDLVGHSVVETLVQGDGAFKVSVSPENGIEVEFIGADRCEYEYAGKSLTAVTFRTDYVTDNKTYHLYERYSVGRIDSRLEGQHGEVPLGTVPELMGVAPNVTFDGDYIMAVPLKFFDSPKYPGRGKSIFAGGKSDCFDALDEVISQWWDAIRAGRVKQYIPECMLPRDPKNGKVLSPDRFGNNYIEVNQPNIEGVSPEIHVVQPEIRYDAFVSSYTSALLMCLQGIISPATLGIDVGKMSSAEAQREKKDVTGDTRNTITAALETALPELIDVILRTQDNIDRIEVAEHEAEVSFGEYGAPDFDSRIETVGRAGSYGVMSVETQVEELWGSSKDDEWKAAEVARIKAEKGLTVDGEPAVNDEYDLP